MTSQIDQVVLNELKFVMQLILFSPFRPFLNDDLNMLVLNFTHADFWKEVCFVLPKSFPAPPLSGSGPGLL